MDRGISEMASMLTLVAVALVIVLAVGVNVLFVERGESQGPDITFEFDYVEEQQALLITPRSDDPVPARDVLIRGPEQEVLWSRINDQVDNSTVLDSNKPVLIGRQNGYGARVRPSDRIQILYINTTDQEPISLQFWNGTDEF